MKIKKEILPKAIKCTDSIGAFKENSAAISNGTANSLNIISDIHGATDTVPNISSNKVVIDLDGVVKTQDASCENSDVSWQHNGILRQALLSGISTPQTEKPNISTSVDTVLPKLGDTILSSVNNGKLSEDVPPVSLSSTTLAQDSFSPNDYSTSAPLPFTSLSFSTLPSNPLSSECAVPDQEPTLPIINQMSSCDVHQSPLHDESGEILSDTSNNTVANTGIDSSESSTNVDCISSPLIAPVPSYQVAQSNLVCQAFASLSSKDNSVTVVYSAVPKAELSSSNLVQKTVPLPSMSEVTSSLSNNINTLSSTQNKTSGDLQNKVSLSLSGISSSTNSTLGFDSVTSNEVDGSLGTIKLDEQSDSVDFNGESTVPSEAAKFSSDSVASDISSRIVIPVSSDVLLTKINGPNSSTHQDISHIITIPLPAGTIYNSSLIPMPLSLSSNISSGSSVSMTPAILSNLPYSLAGITNPVSNQCWPSSGITLSVTNTSNSQISTSVTSSLPVSIMSVAPTLTSIPNSNIVNFGSNTLPTSQVTTIRTIPQDPVCYTVQSPAEILSQLSKAGVFPTMTSSQVSSVLSALGSDSHVDMESDATHHNEILNNQVLSNEKVSTVTQTDSLEMAIMQQEEKIIQLLGAQQLLEHSINGSQMIMPSSNQTPDVNSDGSLNNNNELITESVPERKREMSPYPRFVAMVLNAPSIHNEKLTSTNVINNGVVRNCERKQPRNLESHSDHLTDTPSNNLHEFLGPPCNTKPQRKRQKKTSALREMLLEVYNTSSSTDKQSKKPRGKSRKINNGSTLNPGTSLKISEPLNHRDFSLSLEAVKDNSQYTKEAECYKCKSCPFLSLEETNMLQHIKDKHCSEEQQLSIVRQELKCPGCANVFFTINSLEVHLKQDHQVNTPELKAITSSVIRIATEGNVKSSQTKKKKKKPCSKSEDKISVNSGVENAANCNENTSSTAGSSSCIIPLGASRGALIFSTNNNSESEILTNDQKVCVKDLSNGNTINIIDKSVISFKNILISSCKESETVVTQEPSGNGFNGKTWNQPNEGVVNTTLSLREAEKFCDTKTDGKINVVAQKRKRGRPKGSKSSTLIAGMMGDKDDGQSPKKTNSGHRCNVDNCAVTMRSPENIEYHRSCHNGPEFCCPECAHTHCHWNGLSTHLWRVHMVDMELYTCDQCNYKTVSYAKLVNLHKKIHGSERPFLCDSCGKGFKNRKQLRNHKSIHQPKQTKLGECEICGRTFNNTRMLRTHLDNVHNKLRPHLCNYCGYSASCVSSLKMHMRKHTGEKPFRCNLCDYCTADHNSLRRHKMRHTGDKPYKCPHCPYACIQSSTYKAHLKTKHPGMDDGLMFSCNMCSFRSVKEENYIAHVAEHKRHVKSLPGKVNRQEKNVVPDKLDVEEQSESVIELVERLQNGTNGRFSMEKLGGLDSICDVQMTLESDFETEEITGDISEAELITGDLGEPQDFKICESELKIKSHNEDLHTATL